MTTKDYTPEEIDYLCEINTGISHDKNALVLVTRQLQCQLAERDAEIERLKKSAEFSQMTVTTQMRHLCNARILSSVVAYMVDRLRNEEEVPADIIEGAWKNIVEMGYQAP